MKTNAPLYSFNAGEISKNALARVDVAKLRMAAECQLNWLPLVIGPMMLRPGLEYIGEVLGDRPTRLLRFVFAKDDTSLIELTPGQMRVWIDNELLTRMAVGTVIGDGSFTGLGGLWSTSNTTAGASAVVSEGQATLTCTPIGGLAQIAQTVTVASQDLGNEHAIRLMISNGPVTCRIGSSPGLDDLLEQTVLDTGTHSLSFTPQSNFTIQIESADAWQKTLTSCTIETAGPVVIPTSWQAGDLPNMRYDQSGDEVYVACYGQQQRIIQRRGARPGARGWSVVLYRAGDGPFQSSPGITANFTPSAYYGNATLTSDRPWFEPGHVGALFRLFSNGQFNQAMLGNENAFTDPVRVTGVGATRNYTWTPSGTWSGTLTFQRSYDGGTSGFIDVSTVTTNTAISSSTGGVSGTPDLDNVIAWERVGFEGGHYTSGTATLVLNYAGGGGYGVCRVTGYVSSTQVNIEILEPFPSLAATTDWVESEWSGVAGWPTSVAFHEGRLGWFGGAEVWLSASDDYTSFADVNLDGTSPGDAGAIDVVLGSGPSDTISWGLSLTRLLLGREQSIASARSSNFDEAMTPTDIVIRDCSDQGAERLPAVKIGKRDIFVQQSGSRVFELAFNGQEIDYDDRDLTRLNLDIGKPGFPDIDKATQIDKMIYLPRGDGQCAALLYDVKDEVEAWWRFQTLGIIENVAVLPQDGLEDAVYFVVRRVIGGVTRRFIEQLAPRANCVGGAINQQLDCHLVYQGPAVSSVQLSCLPNTPVAVWADGASIGAATTDSAGNCAMPDGDAHANIVVGLAGAMVTATSPAPVTSIAVGNQYNGYPCEVFGDIGGTGEPIHVGPVTVTNGTATVPNGGQATTITIGLGYVAPFMSAKLAYGAQLGSALTMKKRIDHLGLVLYDTAAQGLSFG
jgi:hypothetical protein